MTLSSENMAPAPWSQFSPWFHISAPDVPGTVLATLTLYKLSAVHIKVFSNHDGCLHYP